MSFMYQSQLSSSFSHAEIVSLRLHEVKKVEDRYIVKIFPFQTPLMYFNAGNVHTT